MIFTIPNSKYLDTLNVDNFYAFGCTLSLLSIFIVFLIKKIDKVKKIILIYFTTFIIFVFLGGYYYYNLPEYTYQEAAEKVEKHVAQSGKTVELESPVYREDMIGIKTRSFLKTTNYNYYIYLKVDQRVEVYKFNPLSGDFERSTRKGSG